MEGLEATEKRLSELERTWRVDAEFFQHRHVQLAQRLAQLRCDTAASVANVSDGNHFSISESFVEDGIPYYRGQDVVGHFFIEQSAPNTINRKAFDQPFMKRSHLQQGDVLLSIIGTVGETSLVKTTQEATCSCKLAILRPHSIAPAYLATYLSSPVGRSLSARWKRGAVQTGLLLEDMNQVPIARFSSAFENAVVDAVDRAYASLETSRNFLQQAEQSLLHTLGLGAWTAAEALSYVRSSREAFAAGRFDAEYFHPAKACALQDLKTLSDETVGDLFCSIHALWQPADGNSSDLVRNYDLTDALDPFLDPNKPAVERGDIASTKKLVSAGDLVVSRLRSYLREIAVVLPGGTTPTVASTEFIVLRPTVSKPLAVEALMVYLRSCLPQIVLKWSQDGSAHPRFDEQELLNLPVPRRLIADQGEYVKPVQNMIAERQHAAKLLDAAKGAVEIAIEDSEAAALIYLDELRGALRLRPSNTLHHPTGVAPQCPASA